MEVVPVIDCGDGVRRAQPGLAAPVAKTAAATIYAVDHDKIFSNLGATGSVTITLPAPKPGLRFHFVKAVVGQDLVLQMPAGVSINGGTAAKAFKNVTSEMGWCTVIGLSTTVYAVHFTGTWVNDNA